MEINPRVVFERMFGRAGTSAQRLARLKANRGVLDSVADDLKQLERGLAARDRARLDQYFTHVREIETRIQRMESRQSSDIDVEAPVGIPATFEEHSELLFDLLAVAFQADLSRVFTFMITREFSMKTYPAVGITEPHHAISHHGNKAAQIAKHATVNLHHMNQFAKFVERLNAMPDGDGTMLEHSMLFYGSGMGNGNVHSRLNVPMAVIGGGIKATATSRRRRARPSATSGSALPTSSAARSTSSARAPDHRDLSVRRRGSAQVEECDGASTRRCGAVRLARGRSVAGRRTRPGRKPRKPSSVRNAAPLIAAVKAGDRAAVTRLRQAAGRVNLSEADGRRRCTGPCAAMTPSSRSCCCDRAPTSTRPIATA
jgi:hypothetical protein